MAIITGYAAVFDSPSDDLGGFTESIDPHAFDGIIRARSLDCVCLFNHKQELLLGRNVSGTLKLSVDSRGLRYECDLASTNIAADLYELVKRRDVQASSFGFVCTRDEWQIDSSGRICRRILEVGNLLDVSPVTYPAYPATSAGLA
jgi:HK97 family phage prohead protease